MRQADGRSTSIKEAFEREGVHLPSDHVRAMASLSSDPTTRCVRSVNEKSFAVVASRAGGFCDVTGKTLVQSFTPTHTRIVMGLPPRFELPSNKKRAQRILGNGVAGPVSRAIVAAAREMERRTPPVFSAEEDSAIHEGILARARDVVTRVSEILKDPANERSAEEQRGQEPAQKKQRLPVLDPGEVMTYVVPPGHSFRLKHGKKGTCLTMYKNSESDED